MTVAPRRTPSRRSSCLVSHDNSELQKPDIRLRIREKLQNTHDVNILNQLSAVHICRKAAGTLQNTFFNINTPGFFGVDTEELNNKNDFDLFPADIAEKLRLDDEMNMENIEKSEENVIEIKDGKGKKHIMHSVQTPFIDVDGTRLLLGAMTDVTELEESRRVLEEEHALRDEMIQFIPFIFFAKDADNDFRYVMGNHAFEVFAGVKAGAITGKTSAEVFFSKNEAGIMPEHDREVMKNGTCIKFTEDLTAADGHIHHIMTYQEIFPGKQRTKPPLGAS